MEKCYVARGGKYFFNLVREQKVWPLLIKAMCLLEIFGLSTFLVFWVFRYFDGLIYFDNFPYF